MPGRSYRDDDGWIRPYDPSRDVGDWSTRPPPGNRDNGRHNYGFTRDDDDTYRDPYYNRPYSTSRHESRHPRPKYSTSSYSPGHIRSETDKRRCIYYALTVFSVIALLLVAALVVFLALFFLEQQNNSPATAQPPQSPLSTQLTQPTGVTTQAPAPVRVDIDATLTQPFLPAYSDSTSPEYRELENSFTNSMDILFAASNLANSYIGTSVNGFRSGSVIVSVTISFNGNVILQTGAGSPMGGQSVESTIGMAVVNLIKIEVGQGLCCPNVEIDSNSVMFTKVTIEGVTTSAPTQQPQTTVPVTTPVPLMTPVPTTVGEVNPPTIQPPIPPTTQAPIPPSTQAPIPPSTQAPIGPQSTPDPVITTPSSVGQSTPVPNPNIATTEPPVQGTTLAGVTTAAPTGTQGHVDTTISASTTTGIVPMTTAVGEMTSSLTTKSNTTTASQTTSETTTVDAGTIPQQFVYQEITLAINGSKRITSPGFATNLGYENNANYTYVITTAPGGKVRVDFHDFNTERDYDFFMAGNGGDPNDKSTLFFRWSGDLLPPILLSNGRSMWIEFTSDNSVTKQGFDLTVSAVNSSDTGTCANGFQFLPANKTCDGEHDCIDYSDEINCLPVCGQSNLTIDYNTSTTLQLTNYPTNYTNNMACQWLINGPHNASIVFQMDVIDIAQQDSLSFGQGHDPYAPSSTVAVFPGVLPTGSSIIVTGSQAWVRFVTNDDVTATGFSVSVRVLNDEDFIRCDNLIQVVFQEHICDGIAQCLGTPNDERNCDICFSIPISNCNNLLPYNMTQYPNLNDFNAAVAVTQYELARSHFCNAQTELVVCSLLFRECSAREPNPRVICRSTCEAALAGCGLDVGVCDSLPQTGGDLWCHYDNDILETGICGTRPRAPSPFSRIVNGKDASLGEWPWTVRILDEDNVFRCGATIINRQWAVTAAHCVAVTKFLQMGFVDTTNLGNHFQLIEVAQIITHPFYNDLDVFNMENDIALLKFANPLNFTDYIRPACLNTRQNEVEIFDNCYAAGWGDLSEGGDLPNVLQEVQLPLVKLDNCSQALQEFFLINENMLCAGFEDGGRDTCQGDSGGPLVCEEADGRWTLAGITSFGEGCARPGKPGVSARVSQYIEFIELYVNQDIGFQLLPTIKFCDGEHDSIDYSDEINCLPVCGQTNLTIDYNTSTTLQLTNYPTNYTNNMACQWLITGPHNASIVFQIDVIDIAQLDSLSFGQGHDPNARLTTAAVVPGRLPTGSSIIVLGSQAWVRFVTNDDVTATGFSVNVRVMDDEDFIRCANLVQAVFQEHLCDHIAHCHGDPTDERNCAVYQEITLAINGSERITSPGFATNLGYGNYAIYTYVITTAPGRKVRVDFHDFNTERDYDFFMAGNGGDPDDKSTLFFRLSGDLLPPILLSNGRHMWIEFTSDNSVTKRGFDLTVSAVKSSDIGTCDNGFQVLPANKTCDGEHDCIDYSDEINCLPVCGQLNLTIDYNTSTTLQLTNYPTNYTNNMACQWLINGPHNASIVFQMDVIDIAQQDSLSFGQGHDPYAPSSTVAVFPGILPTGSSIIVTGSQAWVRFLTNHDVTATGFSVSVRVMDDEDFIRCDNLIQVVFQEHICDGIAQCLGTPNDERNCDICFSIPISNCSNLLPYNTTQYPNLNDFNAAVAVTQYELARSHFCNAQTELVVCSLLFRECSAREPNPRVICRSTCEAALAGCGFNVGVCDSLPQTGGDLWCHYDNDILETGICGTRPRAPSPFSRIVNGQDASLGEWPWTVMILDEDNVFRCGATIINRQWAVTAAHCVAVTKFLQMGFVDVTNPGNYFQLIEVAQIITHPFYNDLDVFNMENDIALLKFANPLNFTDYIRPACLNTRQNEVEIYDNCYAAGWGDLSEGGDTPNVLQEVQLPLVKLDNCSQALQEFFLINENMLCAGFEDGGSDTCQGDSGGPLVCEEADGRWTLAGITSFGEGCAQPGKPGVYVRVSQYIEFIELYVNQDQMQQLIQT